MRYAIPEVNIESLEKKLIRIRNKCAKYGCEFKYERVGEHFEDREFSDEYGRKVKEPVLFIDVEVEGRAAVNGWQFAASLEYTDKGNIIRGVEGLEIPERYYSCDPWCEHCRTRRDRKSSFIVFNEETGEFKQVGKSCLRDYTGGLSAEMVAAFESFLKEFEEASEWGGGWSGPAYFCVSDFLAVAAETIRLYGYVKRGAGPSTASVAEMLYRVEYGMRHDKEDRKEYDAAVSLGFDVKNPASVELAKKVAEWIAGSEREDNYFHNLKVACALEYCKGNALGLLASAFAAHNRELEIEAERRAREAAEKEAAARSTWMGEVGEKISFVIADFRCVTSWETQWGTTYVFKFTDGDGREATWKTGCRYGDWCVGKTIRGTIKEQKEWKGIKQTELTRCKVA